MSSYEVPQPILNSPFDPPAEHWHIVEGEPPSGPGAAEGGLLLPRPEGHDAQGQTAGAPDRAGTGQPDPRAGGRWRAEGYPGVTRTTLELLQWWPREGRDQRLFFAQLEAAETIIFLTEARADFRQGIDVPRDEPSDAEKAEGYAGFLRYACKMATGSGKTTVMGMLAAWSILNKVNDRCDARFSDVVLVVCPNVTIRNRLPGTRPRGGRGEPVPHPRPRAAAPDDRPDPGPGARDQLARLRAASGADGRRERQGHQGRESSGDPRDGSSSARRRRRPADRAT